LRCFVYPIEALVSTTSMVDRAPRARATKADPLGGAVAVYPAQRRRRAEGYEVDPSGFDDAVATDDSPDQGHCAI
jgi:hypothetical protein